MRKILCRVGLHSKFMQLDKWGRAEVCKYCDWIGTKERQVSGVKEQQNNTREAYVRAALTRRLFKNHNQFSSVGLADFRKLVEATKDYDARYSIVEITASEVRVIESKRTAWRDASDV